MINAVNTVQSADLMDTVRQITQTRQAMETANVGAASTDNTTQKTPSFGDMLSNLVKSVDSKHKEAQAANEAVLTGKSDSIHQAMLSMQEAGVAFTMMTEVRNKLVSAFQELMKMQV